MPIHTQDLKSKIGKGAALVVGVTSLAAWNFSSLWMRNGRSMPADSFPERIVFQETWGPRLNGLQISLKDQQGAFGVVERERFFHMTPKFNYIDETGTLRASAQRRAVAWGTVIDINDEEGRSLGRVEERVFTSRVLNAKFKTVYSVIDAKDKTVATSEKTDLLATNFVVTGTNGDHVAHFERPFPDLGKVTYDGYIKKDVDFDRRLLIFMVPFKTLADQSK